jgi:CBS domain-containing protein
MDSERVEHLDMLPALRVAPETPVREVFQLLQIQNRSTVVICDAAGVLTGIFTERDALRMMATGAALEAPVSAVMTPHPVVLSPRDSVAAAVSKMSRGGYRRLPVVDDQGRPLGIVSVKRILRFLVEHFPAVIYTLPPTPDGAPKDREGA